MTWAVQVLHDPARHAPLRGEPWSDAAAHAAIGRIVDDVCASFDPLTLWPTHPLDGEPGEAAIPQPMLYNGAAGVVWALRALAEEGMAVVRLDLTATAATIEPHAQRYIERNGSESASYFLGLGGVLLLQWSFARDEVTAERLYALIEGNLENKAHEALWGSSGTMIAALHLLEATGEARWHSLLQRGADALWRQMESARHSADPNGEVWVWTQDLYGRTRRYLGAGHGFAGNLFPIIRGRRWLDAAVVDAFERRAAATLDVTARRRPGLVHWEPLFDPEAEGLPLRPMLQDCHGGPGIVCRLAAAHDPQLRRLLVDAGELVWQAGPLVKRPGLCHGTDGNGYAFLKLHAMTGDPRWLDRARAFAMHALSQSDDIAIAHGCRVPSLWTGDLGLACFLSSCVRADAGLPTLDRF